MNRVDLLAPFSFRNGVTAKNRVALAPMTNGQSLPDGSLGDDELRWVNARAEGGFGIVETCAAHVSLDGQGWAGELGIFDDRLLPGLRRMASALKERGSLGVVQIFHGGARAPREVTGVRPWSAVELPGDPAEPRAGTADDVDRVISAFRAAAWRAHEAGFAGVELHGAHGYLLGQFLSQQNTRGDGYGGSLEGRARLVREATRAVRAAVPKGFVVGVRLSPEDFGQAKGLDLDETLQVARWLCDDGVDFLHASLWRAQENTQKRPAEHALPLFRAACASDVRLFVAGAVWTRAEADALLEKGADVIAIGRAGIANPDWAARVGDPAWAPKRPPLTVDELRERALSETFIGYMRRWKGFVAE